MYHWLPVAALDCSVLPLMVIVGGVGSGFMVTVVAAEVAEQPLPLVTVTV